jgi:hypothetical protein
MLIEDLTALADHNHALRESVHDFTSSCARSVWCGEPANRGRNQASAGAPALSKGGEKRRRCARSRSMARNRTQAPRALAVSSRHPQPMVVTLEDSQRQPDARSTGWWSR